jgi:acetolactate synthase-1/2/3 large subunit
LRVAEALVRLLEDLSVEYIFGIPGVHTLPIYDALRDSSKIRHVLARHEAGAAGMADGYARASGRPGVCLLAAGPGATNALTAISNAYLDSQPLVVLAGGIKTTTWGRGGIHEYDQLSIFRPITKLSARPNSPSEVLATVMRAYESSMSGRRRPVFVELPFDYLLAETTQIQIERGEKHVAAPTREEVEEAFRLISRARKILIILGGGVVSSEAWREASTLAHLLHAPVCATIMGKGAFDEYDPQFVGLLFTEESISCASEADLVVALGCRFSERSTGAWRLRMKELIHVDIDPSELGRNYRPTLAVNADVKAFLEALLALLTSRISEIRTDWEWYKKYVRRREEAHSCVSSGALTASAVVSEVLRLAPEDAVFSVDTGYSFWHTVTRIRTREPRRYLCSAGNSAMGFALPAAIGAKLARPEKHVIAFVGDGSFLMSSQELATAVELNIDLTVVVLNDSGYGSIRDYQEQSFGGRLFACEYRSPDIQMIAEAYGAKSTTAKTREEVSEFVEEALRRGGVNVLDARITPAERVLPDFLTSSYRK